MHISSAKIWKTYSVRLSNFIQSKVSDSYQAKDILQEVFVKVHTKLDTLKQADKLESWVFTIARNEINNYYRKGGSEVLLENDADLPETGTKDSHDPVNCLLPFIKNLPQTYQRAVYLSDIKGIKQRKIAEELGLSLTATKSRIQRGRELIKNNFVEYCNYQITEDGTLIGDHRHTHESWNCADDDCALHKTK